METKHVGKDTVNVHSYNTVIVGAGAAGMNCAVHLYEFMIQKGIKDAQNRIAVVTRGLPLGASRMSGSDKQTYYKMGTSPDVADSAESFAASLTAAGCCHEDLALIEGICSLREFYHLARAGVPFPHDSLGSYVGYKTDHDPYERATSAGPKTSKFMSECLQREAQDYGIRIYDRQEVAELLTLGQADEKRIVGVACLDTSTLSDKSLEINVFLCENIVLAAGGPGELYETTVYPKGQVGIHGLCFKAGLAAENLTESQFGLASTKFRWNVSGTYMQVIPRIYSTDADGKNQRDFLTDYFPTMSKMATNIFLKGYQWPFDPQRIENYQSSLIDVLVFNETQRGRRVFMDFLHDPVGNNSMKPFAIAELEREALDYLNSAGATQDRPIDRLAHMNQPAIDIYAEHSIDLFSEPLEIAVCAQHNNGGFAVNKWWESSIPHTFVIGEMAGTHGVKRPGGSALTAGQAGGLRAAQYIANVYGSEIPQAQMCDQISDAVEAVLTRLESWQVNQNARKPGDVLCEIRQRMTAHASHIRERLSAGAALEDAIKLYQEIHKQGLSINQPADFAQAIQAEHLALTSVAYLKAVVALLEQGAGSRGSHLVLADDGIQIHPGITDTPTCGPLRFAPENQELRKHILRLRYDPDLPDLFEVVNIEPRTVRTPSKSFESLWRDFRKAKIFTTE